MSDPGDTRGQRLDVRRGNAISGTGRITALIAARGSPARRYRRGKGNYHGAAARSEQYVGFV